MPTEDDDLSDKPRVWPFWFLTTAYVIGAVVFWILNCDLFEKINADGWGDFLSGVFSPLAFLWLLYAALAQRAELQLQRKEIREGNKTQKRQQEQLERQANALDAQVKRLAAQSNASFQPVFFLTTSAQVENGVQLYIKNLGASVIDVVGVENVAIQSVVRPDGGLHYNVRGSTVSYWEKDFTLMLIMPSDLLGADDNVKETGFRVQVTRLDLAKFVYSFKLLMNEQRIVLESVEEAP